MDCPSVFISINCVRLMRELSEEKMEEGRGGEGRGGGRGGSGHRGGNVGREREGRREG